MTILVDHLTHVYQPGTPSEYVALSNVSLSIEKGSIVAVVGTTGSGKSTLIQHFNGLLRPTSGRVTVDDITIGPDEVPASVLRRLRRTVGLVFQFPESQLFAGTVYEDVAFGPRQLGLAEPEVHMHVLEALSAVAIEPDDALLHRSPFALSGGQRRRVAIAGVLAMHPAYLVLDEPSAGLDAEARDELYARLIALREMMNITIIFVSHDMAEVSALADRVFVLGGGRLRLSGTPSDVFQHVKEVREAGLLPPPLAETVALAQSRGLALEPGARDIESIAQAIARLRTHSATKMEPPQC